jgi:hypothetical protein
VFGRDVSLPALFVGPSIRYEGLTQDVLGAIDRARGKAVDRTGEENGAATVKRQQANLTPLSDTDPGYESALWLTV